MQPVKLKHGYLQVTVPAEQKSDYQLIQHQLRDWYLHRAMWYTSYVTWSISTTQKNIGNKSDRWYLIIKTEGIGWKLMLGCWIGKKKVKTNVKSFLQDQLYNDYRSPVRD